MSENAAVPTATTGAKFAAQVSSTSAWAVMNEFGDTSLTSTSSPKEAFAALSSGQVQYVAADAVIGKYYANGSNINASIIALMQQPSGYCVGVLDSNSDLKTAIANAVSSLNSNGVMSVIQSKWLGGNMDLSTVKLTAGATSGAKAKSDSTTNGATSTDAASAGASAQGATLTDTTSGGASSAGSNAVKAS